MTVTRLDENGIAGVVGAEAAKHLRHKQQGGQNNFKGGRYEHLFGAHKVAKLAKHLIESNEDPLVEWQSLGFVDDYMVRLDSKKCVAGYQLKNAENPSWTAGDQPIKVDFELQHAVSRAEGYSNVELHLVCSSQEKASALAANVPQSIAHFTTVGFFPYEEPFGPLFHQYGWLADDFAYLSNRKDPGVIEALQVASVMLGAWSIKAPDAAVGDVLTQARDMSPQIVRALRPDSEAEAMLSPELVRILASIDHFSYDIARGFLHWSAVGDSTFGVLSFDCFSARFETWQRSIINRRPASFEELEGALL